MLSAQAPVGPTLVPSPKTLVHPEATAIRAKAPARLTATSLAKESTHPAEAEKAPKTWPRPIQAGAAPSTCLPHSSLSLVPPHHRVRRVFPVQQESQAQDRKRKG
jgi:hypothetical protein